jgi:D-xylose transport system substrate-binding protein
MENILQGYQCGSVYKPIYLEAQDAVALATYLRAGQDPPKGLVNGTTSPPSGVTGTTQPASLLTPIWVTSSNMKDTVIKDQFINASTLCTDVGQAACDAAGIKP